MLGGGALEEIIEMRQEGLSVKQIGRLTGLDRKTIRKYLRKPQTPQYGPRAKRPSKLDPYEAYIERRLKAGVWNAAVLLRELKEQGYSGGYSILRVRLSPRRKESTVAAVRRFETAPGQQAQVDWGSVGDVETTEGDKPLSGFVMTLGFSRAMFADIATNERLPTFLRMHEEAFRQLGGVPREILYDRPKTVLLGVDERGELSWNKTFLDFAGYWGFRPRVCQGYRAQTKGKVESGVKYLKGNFLCGRDATSVEDLRSQVRVWTAEVANQRTHGTTGRVVAEAHAEEKPHLQPVGTRPPYPLPEELFETRRVARDSYVSYHANRYSVPFTAVGKDVEVKEVNGKLEIMLLGERLAEHPVCQGKRQVVTVAEHVAGIPLGPCGRSKQKNQIHIQEGAPEVEVRDLAQYEAAAAEAGKAQGTEVSYA